MTLANNCQVRPDDFTNRRRGRVFDCRSAARRTGARTQVDSEFSAKVDLPTLTLVITKWTRIAYYYSRLSCRLKRTTSPFRGRVMKHVGSCTCVLGVMSVDPGDLILPATARGVQPARGLGPFQCDEPLAYGGRIASYLLRCRPWSVQME